ncbi:hypothetical protein EON81_14175 [bacterium]|nr:MAG: hypothetical protein EON81_14175 [bacterium]
MTGASVGFLFGHQLREYLRFRRFAIWVVVAFLLLGATYAMRQVNPSQPRQDTYVLLSGIIVFRLLALVAAILATGVVSQEVEQKTIVYLLTRPVPRWRYLVGRMGAAMVVTFLISLLAASAVSIAVYGTLGSMFWRDVPAIAAGSAAYVSLFTMFSLLVNRAMIVCLLFAFGWELAIPNLSGDIYLLSINSYLTAIARHPAPSGGVDMLDLLGGLGGTNTLAPTLAWALAMGLTLASVAFSVYWFSQREFVPREDAG